MTRLCNGGDIPRDALAHTSHSPVSDNYVFVVKVLPVDMLEVDKSSEKGFLLM